MTVLEKLLIKDPNPKTATVMALDMMGAGIDMVKFSKEQRLAENLTVPKLMKVL
jgi:hypothetical protein